MKITINDNPIEIPGNTITVAELIEIRNIRTTGTAVALNDRIVKKASWPITNISDGDCLTVISAAFGG